MLLLTIQNQIHYYLLTQKERISRRTYTIHDSGITIDNTFLPSPLLRCIGIFQEIPVNTFWYST